MQTSGEAYYVSRVDVCNFILRMLSLCGVCSTEQAAWIYRYRTEPEKRIRTHLQYLRDNGYIESWRYAYEHPAIHRLTRERRKKHGIHSIRWDTLLDHKLAVTDLYIALGAPAYFIREYRQVFQWRGKAQKLSPDACVQLPNGEIAFFEVQRTATSSEKWSEKRRVYERYFAQSEWFDVFPTKPHLYVVQFANQQPSTIGSAIGFDLHVTTMEEVAHLGSIRDDR